MKGQVLCKILWQTVEAEVTVYRETDHMWMLDLEQQSVVLVRKDDVAGRASEGGFARALEVNTMAVREV